MKFGLDERVAIKKTNKIGTIVQCKREEIINHRGKQEKNTYMVKVGESHFHQTYNEDDLERVYDYDKDFELIFIDIQMNTNLTLKNYKMCEYLHKQKQKLMEEGN
ncbi:hypothetical protein [Heyndrickxia camelliae]|uniref:hypothetical protein n=1 Tax=Heyndrickxia camelliae TaxID=1707093 RepID=UPI0010561580|nr:hypothetical protein [Heyndrickxia camelliae]